MSDRVDAERDETAVEFRIERSKRIRRQMDDATRFWLEGLSVTLIAQRLTTTRRRVYWLLRALQLVDTRTTRWLDKKRPDHLYGLPIPEMEANRGA